MTNPILVTGGTGSRVVRMLREQEHAVRVLSRHPHTGATGVEHVNGDTVKNINLTAPMTGVETVVHLAGGARGDEVAAKNLVSAARRSGVDHIVLISVTGASTMPIGYFRSKAAAEETIVHSGIPFSILRSAQLHEFVFPIVRSLSPVSLAPRGLRFEPVEAEEVAAVLTRLALGSAVGRAPDLVGPQVQDITSLIAAYNAVRGRHRGTIGLPLPGAIGRAYRAGDNLAGDNLAGGSVQHGVTTWKQFLAAKRDQEAESKGI